MASPAEAASPAGFSAIAAALATSALAAGFTLFASELLRISSTELRERVFTPRVTRRLLKRREQEGERLGPDAVRSVPSRAPFSWLGPVLRVRDDALLPEVGLDAMLYIKFTRLGLHITLLTALFDLSAVLWANYVGTQPIPNASDMDIFSMAHVANSATTLWVHLASVALKTVIVLVLLYRLSLWLSAAQDREAAARLRCPEGRTVLVTDVPGGADAVREAFATLYPNSFVATVPAIDPRRTAALAAERDTLIRKLEDARWALDHSKRISESGVTLGRRPMHRTGFLGLWGPHVDSINAYAERLMEVDSQLAVDREALINGVPCADAPLRSAAFVTFDSARAAAVAAQVALSRDPFTWRLAPAPPPADVYWPNAGRLPPLLRQAAAYVTTAALYAMVVFYMIPIAAVSALSTLSNLSRTFPFLKPLVTPPFLRALLEGLLPGLALIIFMALLPAIVRALAAARGVRTHSGIDSAELRGMFLFAVINVFLGNVLAGSVFGGLKAMINNPPGIFSLLATTVPQTSRFFISFIALKALGGAASDVSCVFKCIMYILRTRVLGARRTARREAAAWAPHAGSLGSELSDVLLVLLLCLIFSTIAPFVHVVALLFFFLRLGAVKAGIMYRHEASYEGAAAVWAPTRNRVCAALLIYQATLAGVLGLKRAPVHAALLIGAIMPLTAAAARALAERFDPAVPGKAPPPLSWFTLSPTTQLPLLPAAKATADIEPDGQLAQHDPAVLAYLPPGLQPLPESDQREMLQRIGSVVRDLETAGDDGVMRSRPSGSVAASETDEEEWHNAREATEPRAE